MVKGRYGIDAAVGGMIYARPKIPPTRYDCTVLSIDDSAAKRLPGYIQSIALKDPSAYGTWMGHGLRRQLCGGQPSSRSRQGEMEVWRGGPCI